MNELLSSNQTVDQCQSVTSRISQQVLIQQLRASQVLKQA